MGLPGKLKGIDGGDVDSRFREGKIKEIADYYEVDVINTYQVWLRYELFRGNLSENEFEASQWTIMDFMTRRAIGSLQIGAALDWPTGRRQRWKLTYTDINHPK
jgi:predicted PolB exonuclease-like 3'-5' exonuclease